MFQHIFPSLLPHDVCSFFSVHEIVYAFFKFEIVIKIKTAVGFLRKIFRHRTLTIVLHRPTAQPAFLNNLGKTLILCRLTKQFCCCICVILVLYLHKAKIMYSVGNLPRDGDFTSANKHQLQIVPISFHIFLKIF